MPRRKAAVKRTPLPDPKYNSTLVSTFINTMMIQGKKGLSERTVYSALELAAKKLNTDVMDVFHKALNNAKPVLEVKSRRVGGSTYQVPVEVRPERRTSLAMRRKNHEGKTRRRIRGCLQGRRSDSKEKGRHPPHGGGQQSVRPLQVVTLENYGGLVRPEIWCRLSGL